MSDQPSDHRPQGANAPDPAGTAPQRPAGPTPAAHDDPSHDVVDETAAMLDQMQAELERLRQEKAEAQDAHRRALADFQNYQRRALQNEQQAREQGVRALFVAIMPVLDHFELALLQARAQASQSEAGDAGGANAGGASGGGGQASILQGVTMIRDELLRALQMQGVSIIRPGPDAEFDPLRHEAVQHLSLPGVAPGRVVATLRTGFVLMDRLVRPAQVAVAPAAPEGEPGPSNADTGNQGGR